MAEAISICAQRASDTVARYGGEEFAVILPCVEKENAREIAERIRNRVEQLAIPHEYSIVCPYVTISIGAYTVVLSNSSSIEALIHNADVALYEAKKNRNRVVVA